MERDFNQHANKNNEFNEILYNIFLVESNF
jgi:hypothetical protein